MPSRSAASTPSTTVGTCPDAASRNRPLASRPLTASSTPTSAATTAMPPVMFSSTWSLRRTVASIPVRPAADVTGPMRSATARAESGSVVASPKAVCPGATRSMSVPSPSSWARTSARLDAEIPTTATIAAIPIAMPSDVSAVRDLLARRPIVPTRARSATRSRLTSPSGRRHLTPPPPRRPR